MDCFDVWKLIINGEITQEEGASIVMSNPEIVTFEGAYKIVCVLHIKKQVIDYFILK